MRCRRTVALVPAPALNVIVVVSASLVGLGVLIVLGTLLNDSGIAIAGVMLGVVTPVLIVVTVRGDRVAPGRSAPAAVDLTAALAEREPA